MARPCIDPFARKVALKLLAKGQASPGELAPLAGVSRQVVEMWARRAGIDWRAKRDERLAMAWEKALGRLKSSTKAKMRIEADEAKVAWDQRHEDGT